MAGASAAIRSPVVLRLLLIAASVVGGLAVAALTGWYFLLRDTAEPLTVEEAVTSFRTETEPAPSASPIPEGVYVYATRGFERTDALTGVMHAYPSRSTITVSAVECGVRLVWRVLKGRSTAWIYCVTPGGWELRSQDERHTFFGSTEQTTYVCERTPIRPAASSPRTWDVTCSTSDADERGGGTVKAGLRLLVGGKRVPTEAVVKATTFSGRIRGSARHLLWFDAGSGVPVRMIMLSRTTNDSAVGAVHYVEEVTLRLTSLTPRR